MSFNEYRECCGEFWSLCYRLGIRDVSRIRIHIRFHEVRNEH